MTATARTPEQDAADFGDGFSTDLSITRVGINLWELERDLVYTGNHETFVAHAGFRTDFASVPGWAQSLIPRTGPWDKATVMHDVFCVDLRRRYDAHVEHEWQALIEPPMVSAVDADGLLRQMMRRSRVGFCRRWLIWTGARWGAAGNPARREDWWSTAPAVLGISALVLLAAAALLVLLGVSTAALGALLG